MDDRDLWKSQSKLESTYHHALDSFKAAERGLGSNMDKVRHHLLCLTMC